MRRSKIVRLSLACCLLFSFTVVSYAQSTGNHTLQHRLDPAYSAYSSVHLFQSQPELPPVKADDVLAQGFTGLLAGGAGAFLGGVVGSQFFNCNGDWCELGLFFIGGSVGYVGASSLVINSFGDDNVEQTYYPAVLLGDAMGFLIGYMIMNSVANGGTRAAKVAGGVAFFTFPIAGALAGYYLSRRPVNPDPKSLLNVSPGTFAFSLPNLSIERMHPLANNSMAPAVSLLSIQF